MGGIAELSPGFLIGAYISNINQPKLDDHAQNRLPTTLTLGLGFEASQKLFLITEIEKDLSYAATWKAGIEYKAHSKIYVRTGYSLKPQAACAGLGFNPKKFQLHYAFQYNFNLGVIHQASVTYSFAHQK
jgi:hypothetical protein